MFNEGQWLKNNGINTITNYDSDQRARLLFGFCEAVSGKFHRRQEKSCQRKNNKEEEERQTDRREPAAAAKGWQCRFVLGVAAKALHADCVDGPPGGFSPQKAAF